MAPLKKHVRLIRIIAILTIIAGCATIVTSFPYLQLYDSVIQGGILTTDGKPTVVSVSPESPASVAGIEEGDIILSINGDEIESDVNIRNVIKTYAGREVMFELQRGGREFEIVIVPRATYPPDQGPLGFAYRTVSVKELPTWSIVTTVVYKSYMGEEIPSSTLQLYPAKDSPKYQRLQDLVFGLYSLLIGYGLWKMKKWSMFGFIALFIINISMAAPLLNDPANYAAASEKDPILRSLTGEVSRNQMIILISSLILEAMMSVYIYGKRKLFTAS